MRRSQISAILDDAASLIASYGFALPPFAHWTIDDAREARASGVWDGLAAARLGWDVTDFGLGAFERYGLTLFTIRNGAPGEPTGKTYAEKIMVVQPGQTTPMHFHWRKTEDIIVRGGGRLAIRLAPSDAAEEPLDQPVSVYTDGRRRDLAAGQVLELGVGESVTLPPGLYHEFWGVGEPVLVGEVSSVNDDATDNRFAQPVGRFPEIEEDEPPRRLLIQDWVALWS